MNDTATAPSSHDANCDTINTLLLGELAAVETYDQAMEKLEDQHILADLERFREEHARAVRVLREQIVNHGGEPVECTGPWGASRPRGRDRARRQPGHRAAWRCGKERNMASTAARTPSEMRPSPSSARKRFVRNSSPACAATSRN